MAHAWAAGLTGELPAGVSCALEPASSSDADGLTGAIGGALPNVAVAVAPAGGQSDEQSDGGAGDGKGKAHGSGDAADSGSASGTTLTLTLPDGLSADARARLCWQTAGWLVTQARQYGIDALRADGMEWNRKSGAWTGSEAAEQVITVTLA